MGEISMSGSTRERGAAVIGRKTFHPVLSSLLYLALAASAAEKLDILLIVSDDQGQADAGHQGCQDIPAPHPDRLGVRLSARGD
jgi:hypothetical protein